MGPQGNSKSLRLFCVVQYTIGIQGEQTNVW